MTSSRVAMVLKVRDEADVIESNLRFHAALGVDVFLIADNGSVDGTREILRRWEDAGLAHVWDREGSFRREGARWLTEMARFAAVELAADWVIHADADEFWWPLSGDLRSSLASVPRTYGTVMAARGEFLGGLDSGARHARSLQRPKVAHRGDPNVVVLHDGAHDVVSLNEGQSLESATRPIGRAVTRAVRSDREAVSDRLTWAPVWPLRIFHFPVRSPAQFKRRIELAFLDEQVFDRGWSARLREEYEDGRFDALYSRVTYGDAEIAAGLETGAFVEDTRVRDLLARCPDPLTEEPISLTVEPDPTELGLERAEVERDGLQALSRANRGTMVRLDHVRLMEASRRDKRIALARAKRKAEWQAERRGRRIDRLVAALERERSRPVARVRRAVKRRTIGLFSRNGGDRPAEEPATAPGEEPAEAIATATAQPSQ